MNILHGAIYLYCLLYYIPFLGTKCSQLIHVSTALGRKKLKSCGRYMSIIARMYEYTARTIAIPSAVALAVAPT